MSYLDQPRIDFTGRFFTNVSTINNDLANYDPTVPVGDPGWNPNGIALFKFDSCTITGVQAPGDNSKLLGAPITSLTQPALMPPSAAQTEKLSKVSNVRTG